MAQRYIKIPLLGQPRGEGRWFKAEDAAHAGYDFDEIKASGSFPTMEVVDGEPFPEVEPEKISHLKVR